MRCHIRSLRVLAALLALLILPAHAQPAHAQPDTKFSRLVIALQNAPLEWRVDFANLAVSQLAHAYITEAHLARTAREGDPTEQARWSRSVEGYANDLLLLKQNLAQGFDVSLQWIPSTGAVVASGGYRMMLTYPRPGQQATFEHSLLEQFCQFRECTQLAGTQTPAAPDMPVTGIKPDWAFTEEGAVCTYNRLSLTFQPEQNAGDARPFCTAFFGEVDTLATELKKLQQFGLKVEWNSLRIQPGPTPQLHLVQLNENGDTLSLPLPILYNHPGLLAQLRHWLINRINDDPSPLSLSAGALTF